MKTQFDGAVITEQGQTCAVVSVQPAIFQNSVNATMIIKALLPAFNGIPVVLMTLDTKGVPAYFGRGDLITLLENINIKEASWNQIDAEIDLGNSCPLKEEVDE
ncbi:conserved hypothetical protein [Candidatus Desulfosporosinus infrequens]|uniref:Uncharacterized protein n=1 Tax=Candidatus Desulfosporosinus infrequens TaxID=2043169 RepID=A0A2U3KB15_9FIRM|nr:conserved hypothetical protein [Candidatus Desulfosporosinus infrequens]